MILRSRVRDCLFLNWALPREALPEPPDPLRYQTHEHDGVAWVFASALLFRHQGIHLLSAPWARFSYPQLNLRFYTLDRDDVPSVLFHAMWVPRWVAPAARVIGRQPVRAATFDYPESLDAAETLESSDAVFRWRVGARVTLDVEATSGSPGVGEGPRLGCWDDLVGYFRLRPRGYVNAQAGLRRVETSQVSTSVLPMRVELRQRDLLERCLPLPAGWPALHSAWICPELRFDFELLPEAEAALAPQVPAPG